MRGAVRGLFRRQYEQTVAVNDVSFAIEQANWSASSAPTARAKPPPSRCFPACCYPTGGSARVLGYAPWERDDGYRRQFALLLGQKNQLWWDLPARESLELNSKIYGIPAAAFERTVAELTRTARRPATSSTSWCANFRWANA